MLRPYQAVALELRERQRYRRPADGRDLGNLLVRDGELAARTLISHPQEPTRKALIDVVLGVAGKAARRVQDACVRVTQQQPAKRRSHRRMLLIEDVNAQSPSGSWRNDCDARLTAICVEHAIPFEHAPMPDSQNRRWPLSSGGLSPRPTECIDREVQVLNRLTGSHKDVLSLQKDAAKRSGQALDIAPGQRIEHTVSEDQAVRLGRHPPLGQSFRFKHRRKPYTRVWPRQ